jgi:hypothetical protein
MSILLLKKTFRSQIIGNSTAQTKFLVFSTLDPPRFILALTHVTPALARWPTSRNVQMLTCIFHSIYTCLTVLGPWGLMKAVRAHTYATYQCQERPEVPRRA